MSAVSRRKPEKGPVVRCAALLRTPRMMSPYINTQPVREHVAPSSEGGELSVTLLHGTGPDAGKRCIHRVTTDRGGRLRSDIVYFYDATVKEADIEGDFVALARNTHVSMGQLHHTESMLNRGPRHVR